MKDRDNTGYDLRNLLIGAEGTLGSSKRRRPLKLFPNRTRWNRLCRARDSRAAALKLLSLAAERARATITSFELLFGYRRDLSRRHGLASAIPWSASIQWYVLMELSSRRDDARAR